MWYCVCTCVRDGNRSSGVGARVRKNVVWNGTDETTESVCMSKNECVRACVRACVCVCVTVRMSVCVCLSRYVPEQLTGLYNLITKSVSAYCMFVTHTNEMFGVCIR